MVHVMESCVLHHIHDTLNLGRMAGMMYTGISE